MPKTGKDVQKAVAKLKKVNKYKVMGAADRAVKAAQREGNATKYPTLAKGGAPEHKALEIIEREQARMRYDGGEEQKRISRLLGMDSALRGTSYGTTQAHYDQAMSFAEKYAKKSEDKKKSKKK